jgi:hypothetical protein
MSDAGEDWTELENFVRMLIDAGNASLESKIPDREPLQWAVDKLGKFCAAIEAVEHSNHLSPAHKRAARRSLVLGALAAAFEIGSYGTVSENTEGYIKAAGTAPARSTAAENHEPQLELMTKLITTAEKLYPLGRGHATAVDNHVRVEMKKLGYDVCEETVSRRRRKMLTR